MRMPLLERLERGLIIADGAMGTMLQARGLAVGAAPETWNLSHPEDVLAVHRSYVEVGSQLIQTNSFGGSRRRLDLCGLGDQTALVNRRAAELAREVAGGEIYVGGSVGPSCVMLEPLGDLPYEDAVTMFREQAEALVEGGVDCIVVETMTDLTEARAAVEGAVSVGVPVLASMSFDHGGRTMMGVTPVQAMRGLRQAGATVVGANCGTGPVEMEPLLAAMRQEAPEALLLAQANAGLPRLVDGTTTYSFGPEEFAQHAGRFIAMGVRVLGGCCGTTPAHIAAVLAVVAKKASGGN